MYSRRLCFVVAVAFTLLLSGNLPVRAADNYPNTADGAKALMSEFLKPGADLKALTNKLQPGADDYALIFDEPLAGKVKAMYEPMWKSGNLVISPKEGQTQLLIDGVPTSEVRSWTDHAKAILPGGYQQIATSIKDGLTIYRFKFVKPGEQMGMAFDGLVFVKDHWVIVPKAWRAAEAK